MDGQRLNVSNKTFWVDTFLFNEVFIKNCNEKSDKGYFLEVDVQYLKKLHELDDDWPSIPERIKLEKVVKLFANLHDNWICDTHKKFKTGIK